MAVSAVPEGLVFGLTDGLVRDGDGGPMVQGAAQAVMGGQAANNTQ